MGQIRRLSRKTNRCDYIFLGSCNTYIEYPSLGFTKTRCRTWPKNQLLPLVLGSRTQQHKLRTLLFNPTGREWNIPCDTIPKCIRTLRHYEQICSLVSRYSAESSDIDNSIPRRRCDERFTGYGANKAACLFEMYLSGVSFFIMSEHFLIHQSHKYEEQARREEVCSISFSFKLVPTEYFSEKI